jgi:hypothetical protein
MLDRAERDAGVEDDGPSARSAPEPKRRDVRVSGGCMDPVERRLESRSSDRVSLAECGGAAMLPAKPKRDWLAETLPPFEARRLPTGTLSASYEPDEPEDDERARSMWTGVASPPARRLKGVLYGEEALASSAALLVELAMVVVLALPDDLKLLAVEERDGPGRLVMPKASVRPRPCGTDCWPTLMLRLPCNRREPELLGRNPGCSTPPSSSSLDPARSVPGKARSPIGLGLGGGASSASVSESSSMAR